MITGLGFETIPVELMCNRPGNARDGVIGKDDKTVSEYGGAAFDVCALIGGAYRHHTRVRAAECILHECVDTEEKTSPGCTVGSASIHEQNVMIFPEYQFFSFAATVIAGTEHEEFSPGMEDK